MTTPGIELNRWASHICGDEATLTFDFKAPAEFARSGERLMRLSAALETLILLGLA